MTTRRTIQFTVEGTPIAQPRHHGTGRRAYVPRTHRVHGWRQRVAAAALQAGGCDPDYEGPVTLTCSFCMPHSKAIPGPHPHVKKPDLDNLVKAVKDALKGIAWKDDCQVWRYGHLTAKYYGVKIRKPGARITIEYG